MDQSTGDDRAIGRRLKTIRNARRKSLRVVAGLAGISPGQLSKIENGKAALDRRSVVVRLANALEISPSELTALPTPAPADGSADQSVSQVRQALMAVSTNRTAGTIQTVDQLRARLDDVENADYEDRGLLLPSLIRDLHTTAATRDHLAELLPLAVMLYAQTVRGWLLVVGAPLDLRWQASMLARQAAEDIEDPTLLGVVSWASVIEMTASGAFDLAASELDCTAVPLTTGPGMQLAGMLALSRSLVASTQNRVAESTAALDEAASLAARTGQGHAFRMGFGPVNVGLWRMAAALESGDPDTAVRVAAELQPAEHPSVERQATYWMDYGRALTHVRRRDDAVHALRRSERLFPMRVLRNPFAREVLAELHSHAKNDAAGREVRGMAYRAGLPV